MADNEYHFTTHWRVRSTAAEIWDILHDADGLTRWWPSVYLATEVLDEGQPDGTGGRVSLYTKGWLPYTLRWEFVITNSQELREWKQFTLEAHGDFEGQGVWTIVQDGEWVNITYDWRIKAEKPLLKLFSPLLRPVFSMNHLWAMRKGEESLNLELERRHADSLAALSRVPAPPPAEFIGPTLWLLGGTVALMGVLAWLFKRPSTQTT